MVCLFKFEKNQLYPIHDHKNMLVFTKILQGRAIIRQFDKVKDISSERILVKHFQKTYEVNDDFIVTYPDMNNYHSFEFLEDTIFLDIIMG